MPDFDDIGQAERLIRESLRTGDLFRIETFDEQRFCELEQTIHDAGTAARHHRERTQVHEYVENLTKLRDKIQDCLPCLREERDRLLKQRAHFAKVKAWADAAKGSHVLFEQGWCGPLDQRR